MQDHHVTLHQLTEAKTEGAHRRVINESTPATGKALTATALELTRHGYGPSDKLAKAQLGLLAHPDPTHADFKKAAENQHGEGLGSFVSGLAKTLFSIERQQYIEHLGVIQKCSWPSAVAPTTRMPRTMAT